MRLTRRQSSPRGDRPERRILFRGYDERTAAITRPAPFVLIGTDRGLFALTDRRDPVATDTKADHVLLDRGGSPLAQRQVVLIGATVVTMSLHRHAGAGPLLQPLNVASQRRLTGRKQLSLI